MALFFSLLLMLGFPIVSLIYQHRSALSKWLSPIVLCYLVGMLVANLTNFPINLDVTSNITDVSITLAIPLLLFSTRFKEVFMYAKGATRSFLLCIIAGVISCCITTFLFKDLVAESWKVGGMLVGIYTGGTPNMQAIGLALAAPKEYIILLNAADILTGGVYLILLTSFLPMLLAKVLPVFQENQIAISEGTSPTEKKIPHLWSVSAAKIWQEWGMAFLLSVGILALSMGITYWIFGDLNQVGFIILLLTSLAIMTALLPWVQQWEYTYELGEYFLLIFCVALGLQADFSAMLAEGNIVISFVAVAMFGTIFLHLLLAYFFKIDRDTFLITSTAALYGPAFIGQIASVINNRQLVFAGIALGLLGYAIGNYLGIGLAKFLEWSLV